MRGAPADPAPRAAGFTRPSFSDAVRHVYRAMRRHLWLCLALATPAAVLAGVAITVLDAVALRLTDPPSGLAAAFAAGLASYAATGTLVLAALVAFPLMEAGLARVGIAEARGEAITADAAWSAVFASGPAAVGAFVVSILAVLALPGLLVVLAFVAALAAGPTAGGIVGLVAAAAFGLAIVWWVRLSLGIPAAVDGGLGPIDALERSASVVKGGTGWVFGVVAVAAIVGSVVASVVAVPFALVPFDTAAGLVSSAAGQTVSTAVSLAVTGVAAGVAYAMRARAVDPPTGVQPEFDFAGAPGG